MLRRLAGLALALLTPTLLAGPVPAQVDPRLEDVELQLLGERLAAYLEARRSTVGLDEARSALVADLERLRKELDGADPLGHGADLERALRLSREPSRERLRKGKVVADAFEGGSFDRAQLDYAYRLPREYDPELDYPLILAIPDADEGPAEHVRSHWTSREIRDGAILLCPAMPADRAEWDRVMVDGRPGGLCHVLTALRLACERFAVDFDRVYVAGRGKGVPAALAAGNYAPQRFAGVVGRAGDVGELGPENFGSLPTYLTGAGANAAAFLAAAEEAGHDHCRLHPTGTEQDVWAWIQEHPRRTHPDRVTVVPGDPFPTRAYWLRVAPSATEARATASIDRSTNTIHVSGVGVTQATLYLCDALIDLDRPVRFVGNEVESTAVVPRRVSTTLDLLYDGTSDPACVYVAQAVVDLSGAAPPPGVDASSGGDADYEERLAAAAGDVDELWALHRWCTSTQREARAASVLKRLIRLDPDHEAARAALGHRRSGGHWFTSPEALERFERSQDEAVARARGHVRNKSVWMHRDERPLASRGLVKDPQSGQWLSVADRKRLAGGWVRQDLDWIPPEDAVRVDEGQWWVDGEWFDLEGANRRHASIDRMWRIPGALVLLHSTADREVCLRAMAEMERALPDLERVFGAQPVLPLRVGMLRDEEQYDRFAFGDPDGRRRATDAGRLHVVHSAYFAESWFERAGGELEFLGAGVCYWDAAAPHGDLYGVHSARLAVGLSYVDALDPSPKAVRRALAGDGPGGDYLEEYRAEKRLPAWLRHGGAVYAERYFRDTRVGPDGDPWWTRKWSLENLATRGGLRSLDELLAFPLDPDDREDGLKLLIEAGLLVAFVVDGECAPVAEAHAQLKQALVSGRLHGNHVEALEEALRAHEPELRAFAGE